MWRKPTISAVSMTAQPGSGTSWHVLWQEIIDWWHAVEKLWQVAQQLRRRIAGTAWVSAQKQLLMAGRLRAILRNIRLLYPRGADPVRKAILTTIAGVCDLFRRPVTPSAAAPSNRPANMSSSSVSNKQVCAGRVSALKPCSLCAQLYLASPTSTLLNSLGA